MNKKRGSVLLLTIVVLSILIVFSVYMLALVNLESITEVSVNRYEKMKLASESGIDRGMSLLKKSRGIVPVYPGNVINFSTYNNSFNCTVEISYIKNVDPLKSSYVINSKAVSSDGMYTKRITGIIEDSGSFKKDFYTDNAIFNPLTVIDRIEQHGDCPVVFSNNSSINLYGTLYLQGSNTNISDNNFGTCKKFLVKSNDFILYSPINEKDRVFADIPDVKYSNKDSNYKNLVNLTQIDYVCPLTFNFTNNAITETGGNIIVYKIIPETGTINFGDIDMQIEDYMNTRPASANNIDTTIWNSLNSEDKNKLTSFINKKNYTKLVFVQGDILIDSGTYSNYSNYLVFSSGSIVINKSTLFNNSSLYCRKISLGDDTSLTVYPVDKITLNSKINALRNLFIENIHGYYDNVEVKITGWVDS